MRSISISNLGNAALQVNGTGLSTGATGATTAWNRSLRTTTAIVILAALGTFFVAFGILSSLGWPAILEAPAAEVLPLLKAQGASFALGYSLYFFSSMILIAASVMLRRALADDSAAMAVATAMGVIAGLVKMLGLVRWLVAFPALATIYTDPATSPATREAIGAAYTALNLYADSIGQQLGDLLFVAPWAGLVSLAAMRSRSLPRWVNILGFATAATLGIGFLQNYAVPFAGLISYAGFAAYALWLIGVSVALLRRGR